MSQIWKTFLKKKKKSVFLSEPLENTEYNIESKN